MPKSEEGKKMETEVGEATKYQSFCVGEEAPESSSIPSPPPSRCPSTLSLRCLRHSLKSKHLFFEAGGEGSALSDQGEAEGTVLT